MVNVHALRGFILKLSKVVYRQFMPERSEYIDHAPLYNPN